MKKIFALLIAGWLMNGTGWACGPFERAYLAKNYFTFRVCGDDMEGALFNIDKKKLRRVDNCKAWARLTSTSIPAGDIEEVVYRWDSHQLQALRQQMVQHSPGNSNNAFARWLIRHNDLEVVDFLLTAKLCEETRQQQFSAWYYPVEGDELHLRLAQVVKKAELYEGRRLKDRYALQAIRALFASQQYRQCVDFWQREQQVFKHSTLRDMAVDYVAGCLIRTNQLEKATQLYAENGEGQKALQMQKATREERFDWLYRYSPNDPCLLTQLQQFIHGIERWENRWDGEYNGSSTEYEPIYQRVKKICQEKRCRDMAPWYYALAFLADKMGNSREGYQYIQKAETAVKNQELGNAVRVLKIYLKTKTTERYTNDFEGDLFGELQWLDQMIEHHLDNFTKKHITANGTYKHICGISQYYWNDMMRKIIISEVVPLCLRSGYTTRALQYLNMADNRIFKLTRVKSLDCYSEYEYSDPIEREHTISWKDFRLQENLSDDCQQNEYDYQNDFFINLDSLDVKFVKRLLYRQEHPVCALDSFLIERSYTDPQFLKDIIGTKLIAAAHYAEAIPYLKTVSERFNKSRNIYPYCRYNPFTMKKNGQPDAFYRLHFAEKMAALEQQIATCQEPNDKAELMLRYVAGMKHSTNYRCWPLTSFYRGEWYCFPFYSNYQQMLESELSNRAERTKREAFALFTDERRAAKAYYEWKMFKTAVNRYPKTETAKFIQGHCDVLKDYQW